jgi:hypothetical protein
MEFLKTKVKTMIEKLAELVNGSPSLVFRGRFVTAEIQVVVGKDEYRIRIEEGRVAGVEMGPFLMRPSAITIRASAEAWGKFWQPYPAPGYQDLFGMTKKGEAEVSGDLRLLMQNLRYFKELLEAPRKLAREESHARV